MNKYKVGIIGNGFVGESQAFAFSPTTEVRIFDIDPKRSTHTREEIDKCDFIFVCVPTPSHEGIDLSQAISAVKGLADALRDNPDYHLVVIKSTVPPTTTERIIIPLLAKRVRH